MGLFGSTKTEQHQKFTPEQQDIFQQLQQGGAAGLPMGLENLMKILGGEEGAFDSFEAPIKRQFEEETIPQISEQFAGAGALRSSALGQQLGKAGENLSSTLSSQRAGLQQGALQQLMQMLQTGLTPQFDTVQTQQPGAFGDIAKALGMAAGGGFFNRSGTAGAGG